MRMSYVDECARRVALANALKAKAPKPKPVPVVVEESKPIKPRTARHTTSSEYRKAYREKNKEKIRAYKKKYDAEHREENLAYGARYRAEVKKRCTSS